MSRDKHPDIDLVKYKLERVMQARGNLSLKEMGDLMGVSDRMVEYWLKKERNMSWTAYLLLERIEEETIQKKKKNTKE